MKLHQIVSLSVQFKFPVQKYNSFYSLIHFNNMCSVCNLIVQLGYFYFLHLQLKIND